MGVIIQRMMSSFYASGGWEATDGIIRLANVSREREGASV
jgi:hypothetical protein